LTTSADRPIQPSWHFLVGHPAHLLAFGFGSGLSPVAPGTLGTLVGFPLYWLLFSFLSPALILALLFAGFVLGIWICGRTGTALGVSDHGGIVWDEIIAFMLVLTFVPLDIVWWLAAFALFRLFDIWKPFPISYFDRTVKGGFGVMLDDLLAAGYALGVIHLVLWWQHGT
jgi:phosphatidylglycerophosphatase A